MKKALFLIVLLFGAVSLFSEELSLKTGDVFGNMKNTTDFYYPLGIPAKGSRCSVTSIGKTESGYWCLRLAVWLSGSDKAYPVQFEYFVDEGTELYFYHFPDFSDLSKKVKMTVKSVYWNRITLEVEEKK